MYVKIGEEFGDSDFSFLERYLIILDMELSKVTTSIKQSFDPDSDGLCDYGEYLIGLGFLSIQVYVSSTWPLSGVNKDNALFKTAPYIDDISFVSVVHSAANYFKHEGEWWDKNISKNAMNLAKKTIERIESIVDEKNYVLSNLLCYLLGDPDELNEIKLSKLLPYLIEWRHNLSL